MYDTTNKRQPAISEFFDGCPAPAFAIDADHVITHWNKACEYLFGLSAAEMVGTKNQWLPIYQHERPVLADLIVAGDFGNIHSKYYNGNETFRASPLIPNAFEGEDFLSHLGENGRWIYFSAAPLRDGDGAIVGAIEVMRDTSAQKLAESDLQKIRQDLEILAAERSTQLAEANKRLEEDIRQRAIVEAELTRRNAELTSLNEKLSMAQQQLLQSEKLASIGQLAAGLAHEINNPIGYIFSNFGTLETYIANLLQMLTVYEEIEPEMAASPFLEKINQMREQVELDFLREDIHSLMSESKEGILRVRKIVQDLKDFSRIDASQEWQWVNLHDGIDSTLNIVNNEVKYKADLFKEYGNIPDIECLPSQINQVILNLVVNAAHAIQSNRGKITIRTGSDSERVWIEVTDTGSGIAKENLTRIFDPFFTTKPVGQGTGLGLSLSYGIIQKHCGEIQVDSVIGKGTTFKVILPIHQIK
ncbi:MAG TPA: ATP-binding protein [Herbaspirillum sp.]